MHRTPRQPLRLGNLSLGRHHPPRISTATARPSPYDILTSACAKRPAHTVLSPYPHRANPTASKRQPCRSPDPIVQRSEADNQPPVIVPAPRLDRRRWAMLIQRICLADPPLCPNCGGKMKFIRFIEARQDDVIRKILQHCGLWHDPSARALPKPSPTPRPVRSLDPGFTCEADPDFLEHVRREESDQPELPWDP